MTSQTCGFEFLVPAVQNYEWGVDGDASLVAQMWKKSQKLILKIDQHIDKNKPYAELWLGGHPNGMNFVVKDQNLNAPKTSVSQFIESHEEYQTKTLSLPNALPFLLKILSNKKPLSLQCHPDRKTAKILHQEHPHLYTDANHKPEISLALSDKVETLCGFRQWIDIAQILQDVVELRDLLGSEFIQNHTEDIYENPAHLSADNVASCLKETFRGLAKSNDAEMQSCLNKLQRNALTYLENDNIHKITREALKVFLMVNKEFPNDFGCLTTFLLNYIVTYPGDCLFTRANVLHVYLKGQIIECMACSDNVIRGGLTSKSKDIDLLLEVLDYSPYSASLIKPIDVSVTASEATLPRPRVLLYDPHIGDFRVYVIQVPMGSNISTPLKFEGDSSAILTVLQGQAEIIVTGKNGISNTTRPLVQGHSILLPLQTHIKINHQSHEIIRQDSSDKVPLFSFTDILKGTLNSDFIAIVAIGGASNIVN